MESKFIPTLQVGNGYTYLKLKGILDENNLLVNILSQIQGRLLLIDMAEIERINSCGVRDWVNWLNQIQALGVAVILLRCSPVVVSQANMVANFAADAFIHSFYAPYVHPVMGDEQTVLLFTEDIRQNQPIHAPKIYNESGEELEFDEFEESYFAFISDPRIMNYQVSPDVQAVIQYFLPESASHQPVVGQPTQSSAMPYSSAIGHNAQPVRSGVMPSQAGYAAPQSGYGQQMGYGQPQSPYSGALSGVSSAPNAMGMQRPMGYGQPYGQGNAGYGAPQSQVLMPQAAQPMRHEQPPIPSSSGYQQIPTGLPGALPNRMQPPSNGMFSSNTEPIPARGSMAAPAPAPAPDPGFDEPKPAPQAVSSLAMQSMARKAPTAVREDEEFPQNNQNEIAQSGNPQTAYTQSGYQPNAYMHDPNMAKQRRVFYMIAITVIILVIILISILISKFVG